LTTARRTRAGNLDILNGEFVVISSAEIFWEWAVPFFSHAYIVNSCIFDNDASNTYRES